MSEPIEENHFVHLSRMSIDVKKIKHIQWDIVADAHPVSSIDSAKQHKRTTYIWSNCIAPLPQGNQEAIFVLTSDFPCYDKDVEKLKLAVGFIPTPDTIAAPLELLKLLRQMPATNKRRPYDDDRPNSWLESERDYAENNIEAVMWFLEHADQIRAMAGKPQC